MSKPDFEIRSDTPAEPKFRFGISTLLILTIIVGLMASFFREQGPRGLIVIVTTTPLAVAIGFLVGWQMGSLTNRLFWAVIAATIIQILTANVVLRDELDQFAWPVIAAACAAVLGGPFNHVIVRMLIGACVAAVSFCVYVMAVLRTWHSDFVIEMIVAVKCGALLAVLIEVCSWIERRYKIPQSILAFSLVLLAIIGALFAPKLIPGW